MFAIEVECVLIKTCFGIRQLGAALFAEHHEAQSLRFLQGSGVPDHLDRQVAGVCVLGPLQAIARYALEHDHAAPIQLWHWSRGGTGYMAEELQALADQHATLQFEQRALTTLDSDLRTLRVASRAAMALVCGSPDFTERLRKPLFMAGLPGRQVIGEAFVSGTRPPVPEE